MPMGMKNDDAQLNIAGDDRCDGGAFHAEGRGAQMPVDQDPVQEKICENGNNTGNHGGSGFTGFPQGSGIDLNQGEGDQPPQHDAQITGAEPQGEGQVAAVAFSPQKGREESFAEDQVDQDGGQGTEHGEINLDPEGVAHAVHVTLAEKLGAVDTGAAETAEDGQHMHHEDGIGDGGGGDGFAAEAAHHNIVEQRNKRGNKLLNHNGNQQRQNAFVEGL